MPTVEVKKDGKVAMGKADNQAVPRVNVWQGIFQNAAVMRVITQARNEVKVDPEFENEGWIYLDDNGKLTAKLVNRNYENGKLKEKGGGHIETSKGHRPPNGQVVAHFHTHGGDTLKEGDRRANVKNGHPSEVDKTTSLNDPQPEFVITPNGGELGKQEVALTDFETAMETPTGKKLPPGGYALVWEFDTVGADAKNPPAPTTFREDGQHRVWMNYSYTKYWEGWCGVPALLTALGVASEEK